MGMPEDLIAKHNSKEKMQLLRSVLMSKYPKLWLMIHSDGAAEDKLYGMEAANVWGGKLPRETHKELKEFADDWLKKRINKVIKKKES